MTKTQFAENRAIILAWAADAAADDMPERYLVRLARLASEPGAATAETARQWAADFDDSEGEHSDLRNLARILHG